MSSRLALVTGATGFVGSHLVDALRAESIPIRALVRPTSDTRRLAEAGVDVATVDLTDVEAVTRAIEGAAVVYHLAAATRARSEADYVRANVHTTAALMQAVRRTSPAPRVVYLGSMAAAGATPDGLPVAEDVTPRPLTAYGRTKLEAERIALGTRGVSVVALRPPTVYGPRDRDLLVFFRMAARGVIAVPAGPDRSVQMIHVRDLVAALRAAGAASTDNRVYHVAEPAIRPWSEVESIIARAVGTTPVRVPIPPFVLRAAALVSEAGARLSGRATIFNRDKVLELLAPGWICTTERAERELGFRATIPLEQGIRETVAWYRDEGWLSAAK